MKVGVNMFTDFYNTDYKSLINKDLKNNKAKYYNDIITFDIETTSYSKDISFMYIWQMCINGKCFYGREWYEFIKIIEHLNDIANNVKLFVVWVHNLSFEFRFLEKLFEWEKVFAVSAHKVIYCKTGNVIFRCSYQMSNLPLGKLSSAFQLPVEKMQGDLDYKLIRHNKTELTEKELKYCENDVLVLYYYIKYMLEKYGSFSPSKLPYTLTGFTRLYLREKVREEKQYTQFRNIVQEASPNTKELYNLMQRCFAGGYTHCNYIYCKQTLENVTSLDKTSFYPAILCKCKFPRKFVKMKSEKFYFLLKRDYAMIFDICFKNLRAKTTQTIISKHKCAMIKNGKFDNGRIFSADLVVTSMTELDFETINNFYDYDSFTIGRLYASHKRYLPKTFIETVLDLYKNKTELKDVEGMETEYTRLKALLCSLYGMCVTDICRNSIVYTANGEWRNIEPPETALQDYKNNVNSILLYQTGIYVTAYCRNELLKHNLYLQDDIIYNDTDSLKILNYEKHKKYFDEFDNTVIEDMYKMCDKLGIDKEKLNPVDINGESHFLGLLTNEGTYKKFKTLGCKRYIYEDNKGLHATVAGCPKKAVVKYLEQFSEPFEHFNNQMHIPAELTGKNTHYYTEPHEPIEIEDYTGCKAIQEVTTGISLIPQSFECNISKEYQDFLLYAYDLEGFTHNERFKNIKNLTKVGTLWE